MTIWNYYDKLMNKEEQTNKARWDESAKIHKDSEFYDVKGFLAGDIKLDEIERGGFPDVVGKKLLHLQCHFGLSTLSWARLGAKVTGVDFSTEAIKIAGELAEKAKLDARFVESDIYKLRENLDDKFDCVFTSYGVKAWLRDTFEWARIITHFLKPGGRFFMAEFHPFAHIFDDESDKIQIRYSYFNDGKPMRFESDYTYASGKKMENTTAFEWTHHLGEILGALCEAGLHITHFKEYNHTCYQAYPYAKEVEPGKWKIEGDPFPLMFSVGGVLPE